MAYTLTTKLVGADNLRAALLQSSTFAKNELSKALNKAANDIRQEATDLAPKKQGILKGSLSMGNPHSVTHMASPDSLQAVVGTNLEYAKAQEYGTVGMTINVSNGRKIVRNGKSYGKTQPYTYTGNIKPKFFLKTAMENNKPKFTNYLQTAATRIIEQLAGK